MLKLTQNEFEAKVLQSKGKVVIVDFFANWCGPCRQLSPVLEEVSKENQDKCIVYKVDVDEERDLAMKYDVMSIPTVLFFKNGKKEDEFVGLQDKNSIVERIQNLF